jgi:putative membrane protein
MRSAARAIGGALSGLVAASLLVCSAFGQTTAATSPAQQLVIHAALSSRAAIGLATLAQRRSQHADVRDFANALARTEREALQALEALSRTKGWTVPDRPPATYAAEEQRLGRLADGRFDRPFLQQLVKWDGTLLRVFDDGLRQVRDQDLRAWTTTQLTTLRGRRERAQALIAELPGPDDPGR